MAVRRISAKAEKNFIEVFLWLLTGASDTRSSCSREPHVLVHISCKKSALLGLLSKLVGFSCSCLQEFLILKT